MKRIMLAAVAAAALTVCGEAGANPDRLDRTFTGVHEPRVSSDFYLDGLPTQQVIIESRFLVRDVAALDELGVSPVINGATLLVPQSDGSTGVFRTRVDADTGMTRIGGIFGESTAPFGTPASNPVGLGFLYGDQILIDVRIADAASYDPTAIDSNATITEKFQVEMSGLTEDGFGLPRIVIRDVPTQVLISDGKSIIMGFEPGLREYREQTDIPLLGNVPLLGALFVGRVYETERRALIVHITPTIVAETE